MTSTDLEKVVVDAVIRGVSESSMLASSLAVKISQDRNFVKLIIENIDYETVAKYVASEIMRRGSGKNYGFTYTTFMKEVSKAAQEKLIDQMAEELNMPKDYQPARGDMQ